jgi:beta-lactamase superfamily II metal-dependent hydrolase
LFTSDVSTTGQQALLDAGQYPLADVLQLPQHATARSINGAFIEQVQPQVYLFHNDPANRRGDPDPDVIAGLDGSLPLLRTDQQGTVHLWSDGVNLWR